MLSRDASSSRLGISGLFDSQARISLWLDGADWQSMRLQIINRGESLAKFVRFLLISSRVELSCKSSKQIRTALRQSDNKININLLIDR